MEIVIAFENGGYMTIRLTEEQEADFRSFHNTTPKYMRIRDNEKDVFPPKFTRNIGSENGN